jgi:hypothetical protein
MSDDYSPAFHGRRTVREILCALLTLSLVAGDAFAWQLPPGKNAEPDRANWENVRDIGPDKEIEVETGSSDRPSATIRTDRGYMRKWEPGGLVLQLRKGGDKEISKSLIRNVSLREKGNRRKSALLGAAVGFGIGMGIGVAAFGSLDKHGGTGQKIGLGVLFGLIWGGIGALIGRAAGGTKTTTIYQTR